MNARPGTILAVGVVAASLTSGMLALTISRVDVGVQLEQDGAYRQPVHRRIIGSEAIPRGRGTRYE